MDDLRVFTHDQSQTGEFPLLFPKSRDAQAQPTKLIYADIDGKRLHFISLNSPGGYDFGTESRIGFIQPTSDPDLLLIGMEKQVGYFDRGHGTFTPFVTLPITGNRRINEGRIHPKYGYLVVGVMDLDHNNGSRDGSVWIIYPDGSPTTKVLSGCGIANGTAFSGEYCYFIDSRPAKVFRFHAAEVGISDQEEFTPLTRLFVRDVPGQRNCYGDGMVTAWHGDSPHLIIAIQGVGEVWAFNLDTDTVVDRWKLPKSSSATCPEIAPNGDLYCASQGLGRIGNPGEENAGKIFFGKTDYRPDTPGIWQVIT